MRFVSLCPPFDPLLFPEVNPHLVPLFFAQRGGTGRPAASLAKVPSRGSGLRGGFVLAMFEKLLKLEMGKSGDHAIHTATQGDSTRGMFGV